MSNLKILKTMTTIEELLNSGSEKSDKPFGYKIEPGIKMFELQDIEVRNIKTSKGNKVNIILVGENKTDDVKMFIKLLKFPFGADSFVKGPAIITLKLLQALGKDVSDILKMNEKQFVLSFASIFETLSSSLKDATKKPILSIVIDKEGYVYNGTKGYSFFLIDVAKKIEDLKYTKISYNKEHDPVLIDTDKELKSLPEIETKAQIDPENIDNDLPF
ncbi:MAG: hypothetical protein KatS3mg002_1328 [Candidatus Woesearchaeota archaeon]|nr:MAG: hypothetical protein KatS3mg002_1328 [Candidatus Woesearchaeota archaeon]